MFCLRTLRSPAASDSPGDRIQCTRVTPCTNAQNETWSSVSHPTAVVNLQMNPPAASVAYRVCFVKNPRAVMSLDGKWTARFRFVHLCTAWPLCTGYDPIPLTPPRPQSPPPRPRHPSPPPATSRLARHQLAAALLRTWFVFSFARAASRLVSSNAAGVGSLEVGAAADTSNASKQGLGEPSANHSSLGGCPPPVQIWARKARARCPWPRRGVRPRRSRKTAARLLHLRGQVNTTGKGAKHRVLLFRDAWAWPCFPFRWGQADRPRVPRTPTAVLHANPKNQIKRLVFLPVLLFPPLIDLGS
jgi:hypothetical protein